jgi:hypothetical protein
MQRFGNRHVGRGTEIRRVIVVKTFGTTWERIRLDASTPARLRVGLALLSLVAMVLAGSAGQKWT